MGRPKGSKNGTSNKVKRICKYCGSTFMACLGRVLAGEGKYCSAITGMIGAGIGGVTDYYKWKALGKTWTKKK